jgi:DNA-binding NarL/FixJ family response regulator
MKLLIIDDHPVVREGLAALLRPFEPDAEILQASTRAEGLQLARANPDLDLVFMDLKMPGEGGASSIAEFGRRCPQLPLIVISSSESPADVREALAAGALGYVPKSAAPHTVVGAMKLVLSGEIYIPPLMLEPGVRSEPARRLTERQLGVLELLCNGASNKEIARRLSLSEKTVKAHVTAILRELGVGNRTQAARAASAAGLIPPSAA